MRRLTAVALPATTVGLALAMVPALAGCTSTNTGPELKVTGAYIPQPLLSDMAAGYLTLANTGGTDARLTRVSSDFAADITMHTTRNDRMTGVSSFTVPAHGELTLGLGGNHLMLMDMAHKPVVGERVGLELHFANAKTIEVQAPVKPTTYRPKD